jgi:hypothetical protein
MAICPKAFIDRTPTQREPAHLEKAKCHEGAVGMPPGGIFNNVENGRNGQRFVWLRLVGQCHATGGIFRPNVTIVIVEAKRLLAHRIRTFNRAAGRIPDGGSPRDSEGTDRAAQREFASWGCGATHFPSRISARGR